MKHQPSQQKLFLVTVKLVGDHIKDIHVRASNVEVAKRRALKRTAGIEVVNVANA